MAIKLYYTDLSSPSRAILMCAKNMGIDLELIEVNLLAGEHMTKEYVEMNVQHTVPVLKDGDLVITESRAALQYLANKYGKEDSIYPKCPEKRAMVDQRLFFDATSVYKAYTDAYYVIFLEKSRPQQAKIDKFNDVLGFVETYLSKTAFIAGDELTIADFSLVASLTTAEGSNHSFAKFPKTTAYLAKCKSLFKDYEETNGKGVEVFGNFVGSLLKDLPQ